MATLESGYSPSYSEKAAILTGNPNRVTVEVEDSIDKAFWSDLLCEICPEKEFHFDPYSTITKEKGIIKRIGKGKAQILKASSEFNEWHIGCVDSDYDWILSDYTNEGEIICKNKHLLQTYSYSIENLLCLSCTLADFCQTTTEESTNFNFIDYLDRLSKIVYPLLIWSAYLYSKGNHSFTPTAWRDILVNTEMNSEESLMLIEKKAKEKTEEFKKMSSDVLLEKKKFEEKLIRNKSISEDNAYLFVRGHELFDHILNSVLNPTIAKLRRMHYDSLKKANIDETSRRNELRKYQEKEKPIRELLYKNYQYKGNTSLYTSIISDVSKIWRSNDK